MSRARVLVVEDDDDLRATLREVLEGYGYEVCTAADGAQALEALGSAPEVVLLDFGMPGIDGREFLRRARSDPRLEHAAIVVLSGGQKTSLPGVARWVSKPCELQSLLDTIDEVTPPHPMPAWKETGAEPKPRAR